MSSLRLRLRRGRRHRGPDWSGPFQRGDSFLSHQRFSIIDHAFGDQPLFNEDKKIVVTVNGEINNHEALRKSLSHHEFRTDSDCDVIAHLYEVYGEGFVDMLDGCSPLCRWTPGTIASLLLEMPLGSHLCVSDGASTYVLCFSSGSIWISSEMKGLNDDCVIKRLMTDVPFGVLLSGGLDSSLVASITARYLAGTKAARQWGAHLHSFCGSPDLKAAKEVANYLGTVHYEFHFTVQDGINAIEDVIYHIKTYDVTTIRASTPMFLTSRKIKSLGVKMVISGEGSDEIFDGYLYFHKAPNKEELHHETCRKIRPHFIKAYLALLIVPICTSEIRNMTLEIDKRREGKPEEARAALSRSVRDNGKTYIKSRLQKEASGADPDYTGLAGGIEAVYYKVAGECPKGRVYSLRSLGRKKRRYVDPDASTSQVLAQRGIDNFMILSWPLDRGGWAKIVEFGLLEVDI
ncbi:hypothetical protein Syun_011651 [Stephania yunnanensis]|uniref:Glutamine amidotransferase type-2 domain-containing protein n=1 Tax=Stephania yunnanensis TaxID=152371 RepID=A0AAP0JXZ7_9MAGN